MNGSPGDSPFQLSVASCLLWKHLSSPLHWRQQRKGGKASPLTCDRSRLAMVSQHCLLSIYPSQDAGGVGSLALRSHWRTIQPCRGGYWIAAACHCRWSGPAISRPHQRSLFRAKRTWLDSRPAAMGEGCRVVSSKPYDSSFKHNCTFLSRCGKPI